MITKVRLFLDHICTLTQFYGHASFFLRVEGGRIVMEWEYEAGSFFLNKTKQTSNLIFMSDGHFWLFFRVIHGVSQGSKRRIDGRSYYAM